MLIGRTISCLLLTLVSLGGFCQNTIGLPEIINYSNEDYHGGSQTWSAQQGHNGVLYFANNDGVLSFDGNYWKHYALPNKTVVRSIIVDSVTGYIYVGSQNEIGYFAPGPTGELQYNSLKKLIPQQLREFADIWHIAQLGNAFFFRANQKIFEYRNNTIHVYPAPSEWRFMKRAGGRLLAQDRNKGILEFRNNQWEPVCNDPVLKEGLITGILDYRNDTLLVTTLQDGIYLLHGSRLMKKPTETDPIFASSRIYCAVQLTKDRFAMGTTSGGCYIINADGRLVQTISHIDGLQNNNILCLFLDNNQNLWLGLDNGIDYIAYNTTIKRILPDKLNQLAGYAIRICNGQLYAGTSDGLYSVPLDFARGDLSFAKGNFTRVRNTNGQVWSVSDPDRQVLVGHHEGSFVVNNNQALPVVTRLGTWLFVPLPGSTGNTVIAGTYNGLQLLEYDGQHFADKGKIAGLNESLRFLVAEDDNTLWASHPHKGVYKIQLAADRRSLRYKLYTRNEGLPDNFDNYVHFVKGKMVVATRDGIYEYDAAADKFIPSALLPAVLKGKSIQYLNEDADGNIWFVSDKKAGVIDYNKPAGTDPFSILYFPELSNKLVTGFEYIYPYDAENIFFGSVKGIFHLNYRTYLQHVTGLSILIGKVRAIGNTDSLIYGGYPGNDQEQAVTRLPNQWNSFHFEYSAPFYGQQGNVEYSYKLVGFDNQWSPWTKKTEKDYTNLHFGNYTFTVKARTNLGNESKAVSYSLRINPAWYQTVWAYLFYFLMVVMAAYVLARWQQKKFADQQKKYAREQEQLRYMHQLEMTNNEKEIVKLQNERLATDVNFKNRELASATMHLVERGKVLSNIKEELMRLQKTTAAQGMSVDFRRVMEILNGAEKNDNYWDQFVSHFDQVYSNYLSILKNLYPSLTPTDLKLCAYLRMNLLSKEISQLMNISVRGVEIARYRLRKKLQLATDENLSDFLIAIKTEQGDLNEAESD